MFLVGPRTLARPRAGAIGPLSAHGDRWLAVAFGLIGAVLLIVDAVIRFFVGIIFLAIGREFQGLGSVGASVIFLVVGLVIGFFAILGRARPGGRSMAVGAVLVVLALVGFLFLGFSSGVLAILAGVFTLISGILFLVASR
jgi:hypothetical protein